MTAYATSEFGLHSLLTVVDIVSGAMTAACYIPLAKGLDLWGRAEGFMLMVGMLTLGMVLQAAAPNLPALCAGRVGLHKISCGTQHCH
jgi:predicted MFS family arabinose efflux permease